MRDMVAVERSAASEPAWPGSAEVGAKTDAGRLAGVLELAARLVASAHVSLVIPAESDGQLRVSAARGSTGSDCSPADLPPGNDQRDRRPVRLIDYRTLADRRPGPPAIRNSISVPVVLDTSPTGELRAAGPLRPEGFLEDDLRVLEQLAGLIARDLRFHEVSRRASVLEQTTQQLRRQIIEVQEAERQRIARDLHDEAQHALTAAILRLDLEAMQISDSAAVEVLQRAREQLVECANTLHTIAFNLRPRVLEDLGLHAALRSVAAHTMELTDLTVTVTVSGQAWALDEIEELAILRVTQEALTNVRKHACARHVRVALRYESSGLTLQVTDDGVGLSARTNRPRARGRRASLGISGMRERIELLGGNFAIRTGRTGGTRVTAKLPYRGG